jgi:hypothetical protein
VHDLFSPEQGPEQTQAQPDRWTAFEKFESEYATSSHRRIAAAWDDSLFRHFQPAAKYWDEAALAKKCVRSLELLVTEYRRKRWQAVVDIYNEDSAHFDACLDFQTNFKQHVEEAHRQVADEYKRRLEKALNENDDQALEDILSDKSLGYRPTAMLQVLEQMHVLSEDDRARAARALERLAVVRQVKAQLERKDGQEAALALFDAKADTLHLADSKALTKADRAALYEARRAQTRDNLRQAVMRGDDAEILAAAAAALAAGWAMPDGTLELVRQAGERQAARERMAKAYDETERLIAYDEELLSDDKQISQSTREELETTKRRFRELLALRRALKRNDFRTVAGLIADPEQARELAALLDDTEREELTKAQYFIETGNDIRATMAAEPRSEANVMHIAQLCANPETKRAMRLLMSAYEFEQLEKLLLTAATMDELKKLENAPDMPYIKLAIAKTYNKAREAGIVLPGDMNWSRIRSAVEFQERWSELTRALEANDENAVFRVWNPTHMYEALDLLGERDKQTLSRSLQNKGRTARLESALASGDAERVAFVGRELAGSNGNSHSDAIEQVPLNENTIPPEVN